MRSSSRSIAQLRFDNKIQPRKTVFYMAERKRFELSVGFTPHRFSRAAPSTTRTPLQTLFSIANTYSFSTAR